MRLAKGEGLSVFTTFFFRKPSFVHQCRTGRENLERNAVLGCHYLVHYSPLSPFGPGGPGSPRGPSIPIAPGNPGLPGSPGGPGGPSSPRSPLTPRFPRRPGGHAHPVVGVSRARRESVTASESNLFCSTENDPTAARRLSSSRCWKNSWAAQAPIKHVFNVIASHNNQRDRGPGALSAV